MKYNTFLGYETGKGGTHTSDTNGNTGIGYRAISRLAYGYSNTAIGQVSQYNNAIGNKNTSIGSYSLNENATGSNNIGLGYKAGSYETGSDAFYVDSRDRTNTAGDKAGAILYGVMSDTPSSQTLKTNSAFEATYGMNIPTGQTYKINGSALTYSDVGAAPAGSYLTSANIVGTITDGDTHAMFRCMFARFSS